ncbi:hypothetical protein E1B25_17530 [Antarcticimicrobium sediminis]|uniref:Uncharacterized protein n=1 Tax=Antarcticimicrobium sediminis TaxID=2546227 RepID=A0A4R5EL80_9RHOB|nr:hypothetical protein E1B25_17530 [Antarcticimicrobium sediminis]
MIVEAAPSDATMVGQTWKYVNKNGSPDRRFKDNRQLPICLFQEMAWSATADSKVCCKCPSTKSATTTKTR